jgi:hypothetical protein
MITTIINQQQSNDRNEKAPEKSGAFLSERGYPLSLMP